MHITVLMEDTCGDPQCEYEHGLSLYIETGKHKILMDTGASDRTWENARRLGVDLKDVDLVVLSHGHYDHSGGLLAFRKINPNAVVYMQQSAILDYYHGERYIGIEKEIGKMPKVQMLSGDKKIDGEISLFTGITGRKFWPQSNTGLSIRTDGADRQDEFAHEQCLVIQGEKKVLLSGCAHNGILNILDKYRELYGGAPDIVVSGFHMMKKGEYTEEEKETVRKTAEALAKENTIFYTGHCTGQKAIDLMKPIMGNRLVQMHCGMRIWIEQTKKQ
ncbi:MAG: MBL fold metallo-hydrolase [Eubacterium sp.]|nr:MBL fold metallo-hydrolase [Eubacterium sp.]